MNASSGEFWVETKLGQSIGHDFHVVVCVSAKACSGRHAILVEDAQDAEAHEVKVMKSPKRECMVSVQPTKVGMPAFVIASKYDHQRAPEWVALAAILLRTEEGVG